MINTSKLLLRISTSNSIQRPLLQHISYQSKNYFSTTPPAPSVNQPQGPKITPPESINKEMAIGIQEATRLYIRYGLTSRNLKNLAKEEKDQNTLIYRWQTMMESYLGCQVHVLAGLGYTQDENGIMQYNKHLMDLMQTLDADDQETIRVLSRDIWREVLCTAFDIPLALVQNHELTIVEARNVMHKVSLKMIEPTILDLVKNETSQISKDSFNGAQALSDLQQRQSIVQKVLVNHVYLAGDPSLVVECGFPEGEYGYLLLQCALAEHQGDPLITQYVGNSMARILQASGVDLDSMKAPLNPSTAANA